MPSFRRFTKSDPVPPVPSGWVYVAYEGATMKIVDSQGNSMAPYSRALADATDPVVNQLIADGKLTVISHATVSMDNYVEAHVETESGESTITALRRVMEDNSSDAVASEPSRRGRKKKSTESEPAIEAPVIDEETSPAETPVIEQVEEVAPQEIAIEDTSAIDEEPSV